MLVKQLAKRRNEIHRVRKRLVADSAAFAALHSPTHHAQEALLDVVRAFFQPVR